MSGRELNEKKKTDLLALILKMHEENDHLSNQIFEGFNRMIDITRKTTIARRYLSEAENSINEENFSNAVKCIAIAEHYIKG